MSLFYHCASFRPLLHDCCRNIVSADVQKLLGKVAGAEKASKVDQIMAILGGDWAKV